MNRSKDTPIYNLKAVVQETSLKPDTLRAWERRYGLPKPKRTASGHRLYSQRDIDMLHWLIARQEEGLSISRAVEMWQHMLEQETDSSGNEADGEESPNTSPTSSQPLPVLQPASTDNTIITLTEQWIDACLNFDQLQADQILSHAFALFSTETVCLKLIQQALSQIGDGWYKGNITVQQEHFASSIAVRRMETMLTSTPQATRPGRILIGNPPEEEHTFVPLMLSLLLRRHGWEVVYLGANVPLTNLDATLESIKPNLVILCAQQLHTAATLLEMSQILYHQRIPLAFGGLIFNQATDLYKLIPGYYLGVRIEDAVQTVEQLMGSLRVKSAQRTVGAEYRDAHLHVREQQSQIEADLWREMVALGMSHRSMTYANHLLGRSITAALLLGAIDYLGALLHWIEGSLFNHYQVSNDTFNNYLEVYARAAARNLDERGHLVVRWFAMMMGIEEEITAQERLVRP